MSYINAYVRNLENGTDEPICGAGDRHADAECHIWTQRGMGRVGQTGREKHWHVYTTSCKINS